MDEQKVGTITHFYGKIGVAVLKVEKGKLKVGDKIKVMGHEEFEQEVNSMQVEHEQVQEAKKGDEVGLKVDGKVKEGDNVYKVVE